MTIKADNQGADGPAIWSSALPALIACVSVTPEDAGCTEVIGRYLQPHGFQYTDWSASGSPTRNSLWVWGESGPLFLFAGHTDVVPPGPRHAWETDPFLAVHCASGVWRGRGMVDMKGALACMLDALIHYTQSQPNPLSHRVGLLVTSDEEGPGTEGIAYAVRALAACNRLPHAVMIGEPTSVQHAGDTVKVGRRGSVNGRLEVIGRQGHIAYPKEACNPLHALPFVLHALRAIEWSEGDPDFPPPALNISHVRDSGGATNVIPEEASIQWNVRFPPPWTASEVYATVERTAEAVQAQLQSDFPQLQLACTQLGGCEAYKNGHRSFQEAVCRWVAAATGQLPVCSTTGGTSDGKHFAQYGVPVVELGLCHAFAHAANEQAPVADLHTLSRVYKACLEGYGGWMRD